jgi:hypothetical protein
MARQDNLLKAEDLTSEQLRKRATNGGIASGKARRKRKAIKETLNTLLTMTLKNDDPADLDEIQSIAALKGKNITVQEAIAFAQIQKAIKGDTRAAMLLLEMLGDDIASTTEQAESHNALIEAIRKRNHED